MSWKRTKTTTLFERGCNETGEVDNLPFEASFRLHQADKCPPTVCRYSFTSLWDYFAEPDPINSDKRDLWLFSQSGIDVVKPFSQLGVTSSPKVVLCLCGNWKQWTRGLHWSYSASSSIHSCALPQYTHATDKAKRRQWTNALSGDFTTEKLLLHVGLFINLALFGLALIKTKK